MTQPTQNRLPPGKGARRAGRSLVALCLLALGAGLPAQAQGTMRRIQELPPCNGCFWIAIRTMPPGGTVRIISVLDYRRNALKGRKHRTPWQSVVSSDVRMVGSYYYRVTWPGGRRASGKLDVLGPQQLTFIPQ